MSITAIATSAQEYWGKKTAVISWDNTGKRREIWKDISPSRNFHVLGGGDAVQITWFKAFYSVSGIFILVNSGGKINCPSVPEKGKDLWKKESVEVFIHPSGHQEYFHFMVSIYNEKWSEKGNMDKKFKTVPETAWQAEVIRNKDCWEAIIFIPFGLFTAMPDGSWKINICRNSYSPKETLTWAELCASFHEPNNFGSFTFSSPFSKKEEIILRKKLTAKIIASPYVHNLETAINGWKEYAPLFYQSNSPLFHRVEKLISQDILSDNELKEIEVAMIKLDNSRRTYLLNKVFAGWRN
jgi:hypothetical protein